MKLFLLDGHALVFKMHYAFAGKPMLNSKGIDTSILFGFTKYLLELIEKEAPTHIAVAFDPPGGTFRNQMYPEYKANRAETPLQVIEALEPLKDICAALRIPVLMLPGFEADDVIGTVARNAGSRGFEVYMVTPDKDYGQLIDKSIYQYKPGKGGEPDIYDSARICEKYGISSPLQIIDLLAICGDSADNVPGVRGVGEVGASKLLARYGSLENIYSHLGELTEKQQAMFIAAQDYIGLSKELVTIRTDVPIEMDFESMVLKDPDADATSRLFSLYEFNSLRKRLPHGGTAIPQTAGETEAADASYSEVSVTELLASAKKKGNCCLLYAGDKLFGASDGKVAGGAAAEFSEILADSSINKCGSSMKALLKELSSRSLPLEGRLYDVELMHYLLNPERGHDPEQLANSYLGLNLREETETPAQTLSLFDEVPDSGAPARNCLREVRVMELLAGRLKEEISGSEALLKLYLEIEEPLIRVLADMETIGVKVDTASLKEYSDSLRERMLRSEAKVRELAGEPTLNVQSPKQIGEVIFEKLKLDPKAKKPAKGNWPTDEETLQGLSQRSPIIAEILEYRGLRKLLSTYIEPFPGFVSPADGRVHTTFNQALTATGRLSSSSPNLQNIPIRTDEGREIRRAFVAGSPDAVMMSADYSQIELRVMAHLCGDEHLLQAFRDGVDVHRATASKIFRVPVADVTADQRRMAKTANFGIMYGISSFGLSQRLGCSRSEAKQLIDGYFDNFPAIRDFIAETIESARRNGYVETIFGRRRYIPEISSHNRNIVAMAERNAVNTPIQGSAADIIKLAMIAVWNALRKESPGSRMVLQIHDELLLEVPTPEISTVQALLVREMENVVKLKTPLTVECNYGRTWLDAH